jgi:thymidine kinase
MVLPSFKFQGRKKIQAISEKMIRSGKIKTGRGRTMYMPEWLNFWDRYPVGRKKNFGYQSCFGAIRFFLLIHYISNDYKTLTDRRMANSTDFKSTFYILFKRTSVFRILKIRARKMLPVRCLIYLWALMFIEPLFSPGKSLGPVTGRGWIEVICGSMFSGKTEELIRRLNRAVLAKQQVEIFKPMTDNRYHAEDVVSHNQNSIRSTPVSVPEEILLHVSSGEVVGIDEAQFFNESITEVCQNLASRGVRVIVAGLDMDYLGKPFGPMPSLMAVAEFVTKVHAICMKCGGVASHSYRLSGSRDRVFLGAADTYEARCRKCFSEPS